MKKILLTTAALLLASAMAVAAQAQERIDQKKPASPDGTVTISNVAGSVVVKGWDSPEVSVTGTLGKGTERLEFESSDRRTTIRVILPRHAHDVDGSDLEIHLPAGSRVEVNAVSADVKASGITGPMDIETVSGEIVTTGSPKDISVQTVSGSIQAEGQSGRIRAKTVSGRIVLKASQPEDVQLGSVSGDLRYDGGLSARGSLDASTVSGSVELTLPAGLAADFSVSTFSGSVDNAFHAAGGTSEKKMTGGEQLSFSTGGGGARVKVESFSGSVRLRTR